MKKTELVQFKEEYESAVRNVDEIINMEEDFEVEKDQVFLIKHCLRLLDPNGVLHNARCVSL